MQCWEYKKCGREANGPKVSQFGVCPAYTYKAGEACWMVAGTFCGGKEQGTFAQKEHNCMQCNFYKTFDLKHRSEVRNNFAHLTS